MSAPETAAVDWPGKAKAALFLRTRILIWALLVISIVAHFGALHRICELLSHFRVQYLWCAVLGSGVMIWARDHRTLLVALISLAINAGQVLPWYWGRGLGDDGGEPLKLLLCNVYTVNPQRQPLLDLIAREKPDIIVLQEVSSEWMPALEPLAASYPYFKAIPQSDNFGIGLWSRIPGKIERIDFVDEGLPSLAFRFIWRDSPAVLLGTHPLPPVAEEAFRMRNAQFDAIAKWARARVMRPEGTAVIVLGDLNTTPWSPFHARLVHDSDLANARRRFGVLPSWPTWLPPLMIPLDHCLVGGGFDVRAIRTGPRIGSDHLPLIVELGFWPED